MSSPLWKIAAAAACLVVVSVAHANAQVCGDADDSGTVSVTDGVQTLRAAAALSSTCTNARCDVDGSGSVTVTDGVNVLRKAAGIAITESCPGTSRDDQVESFLGKSLPVFGDLIKNFGGAGGARVAGTTALACDNQDGSAEVDNETGEISFFNCQLGTVVYDGTIGGDESTLFLTLDILDLTTGEEQSFDGQFGGAFVGENFVVTGFFDFASSSFGLFSVEFNELATTPDGFFVGGSLAFSVDDATIPEVVAIQLSFAPSDIARVDVLLDDSSSIPFDFNLVTGELIPVSN